MTDHYEVLGVRPDATPDELRRAYRERARVLHPDAAGDAEAMRRLNDAWRVLRDVRSRSLYDQALGTGRPDGAEDTAPDDHRAGLTRHGPPVFARPGLWMVMVAVLVLIFVFTAYAGGGAGSGGTP